MSFFSIDLIDIMAYTNRQKMMVVLSVNVGNIDSVVPRFCACTCTSN